MKKSPVENIKAIEEVKAQVLAHPMCGIFEESDEYYQVYYPEGTSWIGAVRGHHDTCGKLVALDRMLAAMQRHYEEGQIWFQRFGS